MAGLMGYLAAGALGGAGKGLSENAKSEMAFNYEQMNAQIKAEMEQRMYERGRTDKAADYATQKSDEIQKEGRALGNEKDIAKYKAGLNKDDPSQKAKSEKEGLEVSKLKDEKLLRENANLSPEKIDASIRDARQNVDFLVKQGGGRALDAAIKRLNDLERLKTLQETRLAPTSTITTETDEITGEPVTKSMVKRTGLLNDGSKTSGSKFIEGKIYTDKNGNKARYENGQFVEIK